jgi:ATP-binding cassette subfamily B protein
VPEVFRYTREALALVWATSRPLTVALALLTLAAGILPAAIAWVGAQIVDAVVAAIAIVRDTGATGLSHVLRLVVLEGALVAALAAVQRGLSTCQSLLRAQLGQRVNEMILEKALTLELRHFEDSEFYDKLTRARREASSRPLSLVMRSFGLVQNAIALVSFGTLLAQFSPWAVAVLLLAGMPSFLAEARFSGDAFRLFRWRSPETRMQMYLETVLAREDHAKEVKLFGLGPLLLERYRTIFRKVFAEDRALTIRRDTWGFFLGLVSTAAFYAAYAWIAVSAVRGTISLGQMTMYVMLFRQGQAAVSSALSAIGGMYEDNLYLSTLYDYLDTPVDSPTGEATRGPDPGDGVRFEHVSFTYPGASEPAVRDVSFHLRPGESLALVGENGSGKTTLIKLLTRLYAPGGGRITLDGLDLAEWNPAALRRRVGVIFQDFARYQLTVGENIGVGDVAHFEDEARWRAAGELAAAAPFIEDLPQRYGTQLGKWFKDGRELSGGQWQKVALARAFMREDADILVLDEPTAAMDARAEAQVFEQFRELARGRMVILISHRFSTVRRADQILVIQGGELLERGTHDELMRLDGHYAHLFSLQARGYR